MPDESREISPYFYLKEPLPGSPSPFRFEDDEEEIHLRDYWRVILKHRRLIAGIFLAVVATTAAVTFTANRWYTATAKIQIERHAPNVAPVQEVQQVEAFATDKYDYYQTQYDVLSSRTIAARVIRALGLETDPRFVDEDASGLFGQTVAWARNLLPMTNGAPATDDVLGVDPKLINVYLEQLAIDPVRNSRLVDVRFTSLQPDLSAEVANRHVQEYVTSSLERRVDMTQTAKAFLEEELAKARDRVDSAEVALNAFRKREGIVSLDGDNADIVTARLGDLNQRHTDAQADRIRLEGQYQLIQKRDYESLPDVVGSPLVARLKEDLSRTESERAELARKYKPGYPKMAETIAKENQLRSRLNQEIRKIVGGIESAYLAAKNREDELAKKLEQQNQIALGQKDVGADYGTLKRDADTARQLYTSLLQRLKDVDVAEEIKVSNVSVVDAASPPIRPSSPRTLLNLALASVVGLMFGVGVAFFREYLDDTVKTPEDVARTLGLPTLGVVPSFETPALAYGTAYGGTQKTKGASGNGHGHGRSGALPATRTATPGATELVASVFPRSIVAEAYRTIRTGILLGSADVAPQVILFTSGASGEGKTVTAINQALTLVQSGARVLLVDADIRKPRVHRIFKVPNGHGLSSFLAGQSTIEQVVHPVSLSGNGLQAKPAGIEGQLFVLPSGPPPPNPAELLGSRRMHDTLKALREKFDYIVVDTPPILPVTDAALLSPMCDGVVLVVRGQETPTEIARKSRDRLRYVNAKILGVVLNDVDVSSGDYYQYHRYYYSYYAETETGAHG